MRRSNAPFAPDDLRAIETAVARAESRSSVELVVSLTGASDPYHLAAWKAAALGAAALALVAGIVFAAGERWDVWLEGWLVLPAMSGAAAGYLAGLLVAPLRRALIDDQILEERVRQRATVEFFERGLAATRDRTGVLLFVSLFERRCVVLPDAGLRGRVPDAVWRSTTDRLQDAIERGRVVDGLVSACEACGAAAREHGPRRRADDVNELPDAPRLEDPA